MASSFMPSLRRVYIACLVKEPQTHQADCCTLSAVVFVRGEAFVLRLLGSRTHQMNGTTPNYDLYIYIVKNHPHHSCTS